MRNAYITNINLVVDQFKMGIQSGTEWLEIEFDRSEIIKITDEHNDVGRIVFDLLRVLEVWDFKSLMEKTVVRVDFDAKQIHHITEPISVGWE